jgi:FixH
MNWGNKLLVTFIVFGAGMMYLVYRSLNTNYELVEKDYYNQELRYQDVIDGTRSANALTSQVKMEQTKEGILLELPAEMKMKTLSGKIWFYCAYDEGKDKKFDLQINDSGMQSFKPDAIAPGSYTVRINWNDAGKLYYAEKSLTVL